MVLLNIALSVEESWSKKIIEAAEKKMFKGDTCPVQNAHQFIDGKRFGDLKRDVAGISEKVRIQALNHLQEMEEIKRHSFHEVPPKVAYSLNDRGITLIHFIHNVLDC